MTNTIKIKFNKTGKDSSPNDSRAEKKFTATHQRAVIITLNN
jgi:hypothetical protein